MSIPQRAAIVVSVSLALLFSLPAVAGAENVDRGLLERYQPVTYLDPAEQFRPASIQSFVSDADLERFDAGSWSLADADPEPGDLLGPGTGTWRLNQDRARRRSRSAGSPAMRPPARKAPGRASSTAALPARRAPSCWSTGTSTTTTSTRTRIPRATSSGRRTRATGRTSTSSSPTASSAPVRRLQPALPGAEARLERDSAPRNPPDRACSRGALTRTTSRPGPIRSTFSASFRRRSRSSRRPICRSRSTTRSPVASWPGHKRPAARSRTSARSRTGIRAGSRSRAPGARFSTSTPGPPDRNGALRNIAARARVPRDVGRSARHARRLASGSVPSPSNTGPRRCSGAARVALSRLRASPGSGPGRCLGNSGACPVSKSGR